MTEDEKSCTLDEIAAMTGYSASVIGAWLRERGAKFERTRGADGMARKYFPLGEICRALLPELYARRERAAAEIEEVRRKREKLLTLRDDPGHPGLIRAVDVMERLGLTGYLRELSTNGLEAMYFGERYKQRFVRLNDARANMKGLLEYAESRAKQDLPKINRAIAALEEMANEGNTAYGGTAAAGCGAEPGGDDAAGDRRGNRAGQDERIPNTGKGAGRDEAERDNRSNIAGRHEAER